MIKKLCLAICVSAFFWACNDGDLEVETISLNNQDVLSCTSDTTATFLFKYDSKQALILNLPSGILVNSNNTTSGAIPGNYKLYYREFDGTISTSYFCGDYPPSSPSVIAQTAATGGTVSITTQAIFNSSGTLLRYDHLITIKDLVLVNSKGEKIIDSNFIFGTYQTTVD